MVDKPANVQRKSDTEDNITEFYSGDATALGDHESVGYLIKLANQT